MTNINETVAGLELALASASSMIERLTLERDIARDERAALWDELAESRANDRTAMGYLSAIRDALGFDGEYPALVAHCQEIAPQPPAISAEPNGWIVCYQGGCAAPFAVFSEHDAKEHEAQQAAVSPFYYATPIADANDAARCVELQISNDGLWAHFRVGNGYAYSQNLSADRMSKRFADEYIAAMQKGGA